MECIALQKVHEMTGRQPLLYFRFCWWFTAPVLIMAVWVFSLIDYEPPKYDNGEYRYPLWAEALGWFIASMSLICITAFAVIVFIRSEGNTFMEKLYNSVRSQIYECKQCESDKCIHTGAHTEELRDMLETKLPAPVRSSGLP